MAYNAPIAYLFTFTPYGTRLHGDERGTVDAWHNEYGTPLAPLNEPRQVDKIRAMSEDALLIDPKMRGIIEDTLEQHCKFRGWKLYAYNVRTNHVHAVISARSDATKMLNDLKAYLTRALRRGGAIAGRNKVWTEGGSKRHLFTDKAVARACAYVRDAQGPDLPRDDPDDNSQV
jgi:REP element-mobilizing transposase RayT